MHDGILITRARNYLCKATANLVASGTKKEWDKCWGKMWVDGRQRLVLKMRSQCRMNTDFAFAFGMNAALGLWKAEAFLGIEILSLQPPPFLISYEVNFLTFSRRECPLRLPYARRKGSVPSKQTTSEILCSLTKLRSWPLALSRELPQNSLWEMSKLLLLIIVVDGSLRRVLYDYFISTSSRDL